MQHATEGSLAPHRATYSHTHAFLLLCSLGVERQFKVLTFCLVCLIVCRSSLAKNAMIALKEMLSKLKKGIDPDVEAFMPTLMKRSADTNLFIAEEGKQCLE